MPLPVMRTSCCSDVRQLRSCSGILVLVVGALGSGWVIADVRILVPLFELCKAHSVVWIEARQGRMTCIYVIATLLPDSAAVDINHPRRYIPLWVPLAC